MSTIAQSATPFAVAPAPTRKRAISSIGFCVADRPMRAGGAPTSAVEPLERKREMAPRLLAATAWISSTITARTVASIARLRARAEQHVQRLGRRHQDVRGLAKRALALVGRRVAGAHGSADLDLRQSERRELGADSGERRLEVDPDVVRQRLQRRDVDDDRFVGQPFGPQALANKAVERGEKRGQRLAGAGRRGDERVPPGADLRPGGALRFGRRREGAAEPADDGGVEVGERRHVVAAMQPRGSFADQSSGPDLKRRAPRQ